MKKELLPPDTLTPCLKNYRLELLNILKLKEKAQKNLPQGHLRIEQKNCGHRVQFYHVTTPTNPRGLYIPRSHSALVQRLAQKDYDYKLIKLLNLQIKALEKLLYLTDNKITDLYAKLCPARKNLIIPITLTNEQYATQWQELTWSGCPFTTESQKYSTSRHELVRSKSEVIIADTLARHGIPYRYEYPLELKVKGTVGGSNSTDSHIANTGHTPSIQESRTNRLTTSHTVYPDFLCLNLRTRQEFYWEHFGLMDDPDYVERTIQKIKEYAENNILPGKNLLFTMESANCPLNIRQIENLINEFLI